MRDIDELGGRDRAMGGGESPLIYQLTAPRPVSCLTASLNLGGKVATAITRAWSPGDTLRFRLCPECHADHESDVCLVLVGRAVPLGDAAGFSSHGLRPVPSVDDCRPKAAWEDE